MNPYPQRNGRSMVEILADSKEELKQFVATRIAMFRAESREKIAVLKVAGTIAALAGVLLGTAFLMFSLAIAGFVVAFFNDNPFRWCIAFICVSFLWAVVGGIAARIAKRAFTRDLIPRRTLGVLKEDGIWIQSEVRH